jgi:hypothetical protein
MSAQDTQPRKTQQHRLTITQCTVILQILSFHFLGLLSAHPLPFPVLKIQKATFVFYSNPHRASGKVLILGFNPDLFTSDVTVANLFLLYHC